MTEPSTLASLAQKLVDELSKQQHATTPPTLFPGDIVKIANELSSALQREAEVSYRGFLDMQVCVPDHWTDEQVLEFAARENPCGTTNGWFVRRTGDKALGNSPERNRCLEREGCVHIMLDA